MDSGITLYHYHPDTKIFTGTSLARLSPLDLRYGRSISLKPPDTTEIPPPLNRPVKNADWYEMYFHNEKWNFRNTAKAYKAIEEGEADLVYDFVKSGDYILVERFKDVENQGYWWIMYCFNSKPTFWTEFHSNDIEWSRETEETHDDVLFEIAVIEGRTDPKILDVPITNEELQQSREYWDNFTNQSLNQIEQVILRKEEEFTKNLPILIESERKLARDYVESIRRTIENEIESNIKLLEQKKAYSLAIARSKISKVLLSAMKEHGIV